MSRRLILDASILSEIINDPYGRSARKVLDAGPDNAYASIISAAELRYGAFKKNSATLRRRVDELLAEVEVLSFEAPADIEYGKLRAGLEAAGKSLSANDMLIAAHAKALDATVVTANSDLKNASKLVKVNLALGRRSPTLPPQTKISAAKIVAIDRAMDRTTGAPVHTVKGRYQARG